MDHDKIRKDVLARLAMYAAANGYEVILKADTSGGSSGTSSWKLQLIGKKTAEDFIGKRLLYGGEEYVLDYISSMRKNPFIFKRVKDQLIYRMSAAVFARRKHELHS